MESVTDFKQAVRHVCSSVTNMFLGAIIFVSIILGTSIGTDFIDSSFSQHIVLNVLGYVLLIPQAILALSDFCSWARVLAPDVRNKVHIALHILGAVLVVAGTVSRIVELSNIFGWRSLTSAHGICGILALIATCLNLGLGFLNYLNQQDNKQMKIFHAALGCVTIISSFSALIIAFNYQIIVGVIGRSSSVILVVITLFVMVDIGSCACLKILRMIKEIGQ